uniref:Si:ch211-214p16.3 n=1 Tax=Myripristis murdjan TaxID=586833 RepID=A0A667XVN7_9TELE
MRTQRNSPDTEERVHSEVMGTEIPCTDRSPSPTTPTSVHELRPGDIKVVAAVGDSLTAANGVGAGTDNLLLVINEYRGLSWSIGGDANITTVTTLPNILREFNPSLTGFSEGIGKENNPKAFLNQAVSGAKSGDMVSQVRTLVDKMKNDVRIDFHNDWKVITMFIGGNDICDFCTDSIYFSPANVVERIRQALDILHNEVPRAIVNLVELLHIVPLRDLHSDKSLGCPTWFVKLVCPCILKPTEGSAELQKVKDLNKAYQVRVPQLVDSGRYDTHGNFTVVLQPFFREVFLPRLEDGRPDRSYFSPDCFHLSQRAHTLMARALWNNMLEPVGNKTFTQDFMAGIDLKCPSEVTLHRVALMTFNVPANLSNNIHHFVFMLAYKCALDCFFIRPCHSLEPLPTATTPFQNWGSDFSCVHVAPSDSVPTSVHRLRPGDIKVVAALGDSLTVSFIGGDKTLDTVTTLPNILKKFNPNIKGMSTGRGKKTTGFNVAVSGAKISGIPGQVRQLIETMKNNSAVDFEKDWKLVTLFIGGNDLCQYCNDRASLSPANYSHHMMTSLDILYQERLWYFSQTKTEELAYGGRYDDREDFTVVVQPFFRNSIVPLNTEGRPDATYFSEDCFHFSERGHADMAIALWNNMLEPVGKKQTYNNFTTDRNKIKCPSEEHPYIFTKVNSHPSLTTTTTTTTTTTPATTTTTPATTTTAVTPTCSKGVDTWVAALLAVVGLVIGWGVTWLFLSCRDKRNKQRMQTMVEMKATGL